MLNNDKRAELVARRAVLRAKREARAALDKCLQHYNRATFTAPSGA
jgi:hypothetical protein